MKKYNISIMKTFILSAILFTGLIGFSQQDILFTFFDSKITNDGSDYFYEVDIMIQTDNTAVGSFKLGSGQLYFNYNTAAFDENISGNGVVTVTSPDGYICGQKVDFFIPGSPPTYFPLYKPFVIADNSSSRLSVAFDQQYSSSTIADDNVLPSSKPLFHLKIKFEDVNENPMLAFEDGSAFDDQFFTACGPAGGGVLESANCTSSPGIQLLNDSFDNGGATLSDDQIVSEVDFNVYPNPTKGLINIDINKESSYALVDMLGRVVESGAFKAGNNEMYLRDYDSGVYFIKIEKEGKTYSKRIILD